MTRTQAEEVEAAVTKKELSPSSAISLANAVIKSEAQQTTTGQCVLLARALLSTHAELARVRAVVDAAREWNRLGNEMEAVEPGDGPALRRMRRACDDLRTAITAMRGECEP